MPCFGKFPVVKNFVDEKDGGGVSKVSAENILSQCRENWKRNPLECH